MHDDELRRKLLECGVDAGPITNSTRELYQKTLKDLENKKVTRRSLPQKAIATRSLLTFSSDESETEAANDPKLSSTRKLRRRRQTMQFPNESSPTKGSFLRKESDANSQLITKYSPQKSALSCDPKTQQYKAPASFNLTPHRSLLGTSHYFDSSGTDSDFSEGLTNCKYARTKPTHDIVECATTDEVAVASVRTKYSPLSSLEGSLSSNRVYENHTFSHWWRKDDVHTTTTTTNGSVLNSQFHITENLSPNSNSHCISMALLGVAIFFFVMLGILYIGILRSKDSKELQPQIPSQFCPTYPHGKCPTETSNTLNQVDTGVLLDVLNFLRSKLRQIAGISDCNSSNKVGDRTLSREDVVKLLLDNGLIKSSRSAVNNDEHSPLAICFKVFLKNPGFGVRLYAKNYTLLTSDDEWSEVYWLDSVYGEKPFFCRLKQAFGLVLYKLLIAAVVLIVLFLGCLIAYGQWKAKKLLKQQVLAMTENIISVLQQNHESRQSNPELSECMPIPHVRDMLIPLTERKHKQRVWDLAVKFLEENESRIRIECQNINGEDYQVWRWLQTPIVPRETPKKQWQGQAFENLDTGPNALPYSPTACLKIRSMFDPDVEYGDNWHVHIQDAILEKCEGIAGIVHLKVDTQSREGCVYAKCTSQEVAGQVFKALHGWWFDGSLVTVRYLRLERYHERFPEAVNMNTPLKPSNNTRFSLGASVCKSVLEH